MSASKWFHQTCRTTVEFPANPTVAELRAYVMAHGVTLPSRLRKDDVRTVALAVRYGTVADVERTVAHHGGSIANDRGDVESFEIKDDGTLHWFLNGFDFGPAHHGPATAAAADYVEDQRRRGFDPYPVTYVAPTVDVEHVAPNTPVTVERSDGPCPGWVMGTVTGADLNGNPVVDYDNPIPRGADVRLLVECDDNCYSHLITTWARVTLA